MAWLRNQLLGELMPLHTSLRSPHKTHESIQIDKNDTALDRGEETLW